MVMRNTVQIDLITRTGPVPDAAGVPSFTTASTTIFAERTTIRQAEYYQAAAAGLKPELRLEVWRFEYSGQKKLVYDGLTYDIIRVSELGSGEKIVLTCAREASENGAT